MLDKYYVYRPMIELIGRAEGTAPPRGRGYDETLSYGAYTGGPVNLTKMTLKQIDALQTQMLKHPNNKMNSSAVGWLQIVRTTLRSIKKSMPSRYPDTRLFDKDCQDELTCYLLGVRGIDKYLAGRLSEDTMLTNLAQEWASFPTPSGKGYYAGQQGKITPTDVRQVLAEVKRRHFGTTPIHPAQPKPQPETKTLWEWVVDFFRRK